MHPSKSCHIWFYDTTRKHIARILNPMIQPIFVAKALEYKHLSASVRDILESNSHIREMHLHKLVVWSDSTKESREQKEIEVLDREGIYNFSENFIEVRTSKTSRFDFYDRAKKHIQKSIKRFQI